MSDARDLLPGLDPALEAGALRARFAELSADGMARRFMDDALARVVSWSWTAQFQGGGERVEPFWRERHSLGPRVKETPGRAPVDEQRMAAALSVDERIRKAKTLREFGRDGEGRIVVTRIVCDDPTSGVAWHYGRDSWAAEIWISPTESVQMAPEALTPGSVRRTSWAGGLLVASARYSKNRERWEGEHYSYRDGALDSIRAWAMTPVGEGWSLVQPYPDPLWFWTVDAGGNMIRRRPMNGSIPPQLSDEQLEDLERDYRDGASAGLPGQAAEAWRGYVEWMAEQGRESNGGQAVCLISIPRHPNGLLSFGLLRILTEADREALRGRRTYKPMDAYLKPEGVNGRGWSDELARVDALGTELSDELHRRRDDERFEQIVGQVLHRLREHDWSAHFPVSGDLLVVNVDEEGPIKHRWAQLERSIGAERLAILEQEETTLAARSRAFPAPIKLSGAKRALLRALKTNRPSEPRPARQLWEAFVRFVAIPIERCEPATDGDMVLVEWTTDGDLFRLSLVRQLTPEGPDGEYVGMHTVTLDITLPRTRELAAVPDGNRWLQQPEVQSARNALPVLAAAFGVSASNWEVHAGPV